MNLIATIGQLAIVAQPCVQVVTVQKQERISFNQPIDRTKYNLSKYDLSKEGFLKLVLDGNKIFKEFNISVEEASVFYDANMKDANQFIQEINMKLMKRGLFSWIGHIFATVGTSIATAVTLGQVDSLKDAVVDQAKAVAHETVSAIKGAGGIVLAGADLLGALDGNGESAANIPDHLLVGVNNLI